MKEGKGNCEWCNVENCDYHFDPYKLKQLEFVEISLCFDCHNLATFLIQCRAV